MKILTEKNTEQFNEQIESSGKRLLFPDSIFEEGFIHYGIYDSVDISMLNKLDEAKAEGNPFPNLNSQEADRLMKRNEIKSRVRDGVIYISSIKHINLLEDDEKYSNKDFDIKPRKSEIPIQSNKDWPIGKPWR